MKECYQEKSEAVQRDLYEGVLACAERALASVGVRSFYLRLAGTLIRLDFAGPAMRQAKTSALRHLEVQAPHGSVDAVFKIWDSVSTGIDNILPPWKNTDYSDRGDIWGFNSKRYLSSFHWGDYGLNLFDTETNIGIYWTQDAAILPYWSKAAPLRTLFHWWMQKQGCQLMHAAAVGNDDGAILITGRGGVGKSGTAISCLQSGMQFVGDDYLVVGLQPEPWVYSLYSTAKVNWDQLNQYPALKEHLMPGVDPSDEKACFALHPNFKGQLVEKLPLRLLVTPRFHDQPQSVLSPVSLELIRGAATLTTVSQLPHGGQVVYRFVRDMIRQVPVATLLLGQDRKAIPAAIAGFIRPPVQNLAETPDGTVTRASVPLISVIIPVFNGSKFLMEVVENIRSQAYPALEVIIVDDGSTDDLESVVRQLPMEVRFLRQANRGPGAARNLGVKNAAGEFLAFLDVDDLWPENNLLTLSRYLIEHPQIHVVRGHAQRMMLDKATGQYKYIGNPLESFSDYIAAALFRSSVFTSVGLFDQNYFFGEDTDWFDRIRKQRLGMHTLELVTLYVRRHGGNMTNGKNLSALHKLQILKKNIDSKRLKA